LIISRFRFGKTDVYVSRADIIKTHDLSIYVCVKDRNGSCIDCFVHFRLI